MIEAESEISHWVVEQPVHHLLVRTCIMGVAVKDLADAVHTSGFVVTGPEALFDMFDCVNAETVDLGSISICIIEWGRRLLT
jgi:hypothetical protein